MSEPRTREERQERIWEAVFAAAFVRHYIDQCRKDGDPGLALEFANRFAEDAAVIADVALDAFKASREKP